MLSNRKIYSLLFKDALQDFRLLGVAGLAISLFWPLGMLLKLGVNLSFWTSFAIGETVIAFILLGIGFIRLFAGINQVWLSNRFRLLPVSTSQLYFSNLLMKTAGFLLIIGLLALVDFALSGLILKNWLMTPIEFQRAISKATFSMTDIMKAVASFVDVMVSLIVELTFLLILTETLENFVVEKYQRLVGVVSFIVLLFLFSFVSEKMSNLISDDIVSVTSVLFDAVVVIFCIWASIYLLKNWVESRK